MVCADNTVVIPMRACDRGKSEARGTRSAEGVPCEGWLVVHVRSYALTKGLGEEMHDPASGSRKLEQAGGHYLGS